VEESERLQVLNPCRERDILLEWIASKNAALETAYCVHIPNSVKWREQGWDDIWLARKLRPFFAKLDLLAARSYKPAIDRVVVLHHSHSVGWHAHFQMATPASFGQLEFAELVHRQWRRTLGSAWKCALQPHLLWAEPANAGYMPYMLGHLSIDRVDWENTHFTSSVKLDQNDSDQVSAKAAYPNS